MLARPCVFNRLSVSFWGLSKAVFLAPTQDLVAGVLPDVRQKGQLCFGLSMSHLVFIFSKRFKLTAFNKTAFRLWLSL